MTPTEFRAARLAAGLTQTQAAFFGANMKNLALPAKPAKLFALLEAGEALTGHELEVIRTAVTKLLNATHSNLFAAETAEHKAWIATQQAYTGRIVDLLEAAHFSALAAKAA